ncbi:MAG: hypothetical protein AAGL49_14785 [Pseudomonadota bacterium]
MKIVDEAYVDPETHKVEELAVRVADFDLALSLGDLLEDLTELDKTWTRRKTDDAFDKELTREAYGEWLIEVCDILATFGEQVQRNLNDHNDDHRVRQRFGSAFEPIERLRHFVHDTIKSGHVVQAVRRTGPKPGAKDLNRVLFKEAVVSAQIILRQSGMGQLPAATFVSDYLKSVVPGAFQSNYARQPATLKDYCVEEHPEKKRPYEKCVSGFVIATADGHVASPEDRARNLIDGFIRRLKTDVLQDLPTK